MSQPRVDITVLDGALGILPPSSGKLLALVGPADSGPIDTPATFATTKAVVAVYTAGPLVEAACHAIEKEGKPVLLVRTGASVLGGYLGSVSGSAGSISAIDVSLRTGTSAFTDNSSAPTVGADVVILFAVGGTRGTAGIVYQISLDGGVTFGAVHALGTATHIDIGATGASVNLGAGTIVAGDIVSFTLTAPILSSAGSLVTSIAGTSVPTTHTGTHPNDDYEVYLKVVTGGTIGVSGITLQWSLDGGRTMSAVTALGTANNFVVPGSGGTRIDFAAGTLIAGDNLAFPTTAPRWNNTELGTAVDALGSSVASWEMVEVVGPIDGAAFDLMDTKISGMAAAGKYHWWIGNTRMPIGAEDEPTYQASIAAAFSSRSTTFGALCAGADKMSSAVSGRSYRRPVSYRAGALESGVSEEINTADTNLGSIGVSIRDANGNPDEHDESDSPGLDDARFYVLRTWDGLQGVYVNRPRLFSAAGSDFDIIPKRRVMNLALPALRLYFIRRLNKPVLVSKATGFILEHEALEIEAGATSVMRSVLLAKPKASGVSFVLSRTDNLLSTKTLTGDARIIPLAYPEVVTLSVGYLNPALQVKAV
jgi:hypothetical protein